MTSSVAKTCFDAIRAKQSALVAGYDPMVVENQAFYEQLLLRAVDSSASIEEEEEEENDFESERENKTAPSATLNRNGKTRTKTRTRKQTPLVNAGYASRVLSISYSIRSFVSYHELVKTSSRIRIVVFGCGVDVIGLWARSLVQDDNNTLAVTIVEIDKPDVCSIKRKMIVNQGMVNNVQERYTSRTTKTTSSNTAASRYYTGTIVLPSSLSASSSSPFKENRNNSSSDDNRNDGSYYDYVMIPGDLNDTSALESIIAIDEDNYGKEEVPTLVVSELVLSYLPPSSTDRLLRWCADRLCRTSDSAIVSLEPLGSPDYSSTETKSATTRPTSGGDGVLTVDEGYRQDYCTKFHDKMERGRSTTTRIQNDKALLLTSNNTAMFHPIGFSTGIISCRLKEAGFAGVSSATNLGVISSLAAASASNSNSNSKCYAKKSLVCPDIFDEHAALILHLQSYALGCGFIAPQTKAAAADDDDLLLFRRLMCPWGRRRPNNTTRRTDLALMRSGLPIMDSVGGIVYNEIEVNDEPSVRSLFRATYGKEYTDKHPAIRKMVKGVLNTDMKETAITTASMTATQLDGGGIDKDNSQVPQNNTSSESSSAIGNLYRSSGGIFLVASKYTTTLQPVFSEDKTKIGQNIGDGATTIQSKVIRQVVGCVGIRSYQGKDAVDSNSTSTSSGTTILEIFRLAVAANHRGQGIGGTLLRSVEAYAHEQYNTNQRRRRQLGNLKFVANTLTILEDATNLYEKCGYRSEKETPLGNTLVLRTYTKEAGINNNNNNNGHP